MTCPSVPGKSILCTRGFLDKSEDLDSLLWPVTEPSGDSVLLSTSISPLKTTNEVTAGIPSTTDVSVTIILQYFKAHAVRTVFFTYHPSLLCSILPISSCLSSVKVRFVPDKYWEFTIYLGTAVGIFRLFFHLTPHSYCIEWITISVHFTDEKLRLRKVKQLACNHITNTWQRQDVKYDGLRTQTTLLDIAVFNIFLFSLLTITVNIVFQQNNIWCR